jgi:hypothetical protein
MSYEVTAVCDECGKRGVAKAATFTLLYMGGLYAEDPTLPEGWLRVTHTSHGRCKLNKMFHEWHTAAVCSKRCLNSFKARHK